MRSGVPDRVRDARLHDRINLDLHLEELRERNQDVLRARATRWHDQEPGTADGEHPHAHNKG